MISSSSKPFVVDMDSHVMEPSDLWDTYLEPKYRDRSIRIHKNDDGLEELIVDNKILLTGRLAVLGGVEPPADELFTNPAIPYAQGCPRASYETSARLGLLDDWGVDAGVVFPSIGILWDKAEDPEKMVKLIIQEMSIRTR